MRVQQKPPLAKTMFVIPVERRAPSGYVPDEESSGYRTFQLLAFGHIPAASRTRSREGVEPDGRRGVEPGG